MSYSKNKTQKSTTREESLFDLINPRKNYKYICNCMVCEGKEVEARTQKKHANDKILWKSNKERKIQLAMIETRKFNYEGKLITHVEVTTFMHIGCKSDTNDHIGHLSRTRYIDFNLCNICNILIK
jgi:hypothetical protein